ncbi:MAG: metalloregulator ArsR/SmtB family transcription factor [Acidobacteria bacterium]|nr:metalloregulator ArsR/SmtB family transcription factor [Acidobacteriota bacterium]
MEEADVVRSLAALAQPLRLRTFRALVVAGQEGLTPTALAEHLGIAPNTLSFHLKELSHAGLVEAERQGRNLVYRAAWMKDQRQPYGYYSAMAKLFASETASKCANHALQVFGGYGYCQDYPAERLLRDAKITELYEGTSEIHRLVIFRGLLNEAQDGWMAKV